MKAICEMPFALYLCFMKTKNACGVITYLTDERNHITYFILLMECEGH